MEPLLKLVQACLSKPCRRAKNPCAFTPGSVKIAFTMKRQQVQISREGAESVAEELQGESRWKTARQPTPASTYYDRLGVHPSASVVEIRRAYRDLSRLYHPDTTQLAPDAAKQAFQQLNEAYATLTSPDRRLAYDRTIGYSSVFVSQGLPNLSQPQPTNPSFSSAYLDPNDRPLSPGELFALFILGMTFLACLALAIILGVTRGESVLAEQRSPFPMTQTLPQSSSISTSTIVEKSVVEKSIEQPLVRQNSAAPNSAVPNSAKPMGIGFSHSSLSSGRSSGHRTVPSTVKRDAGDTG
ncbi:MAG: J domain-containing protein [Synechococcales bacterium]|nr:J domain-containing protein [Synechococcales bacterium]